MKPRVLLTTKDFIVIKKPSGLPTLPSKPGEQSVKSLYPSHFPVHRLDKGTSGLLLLAKTTKSADHFIQLFKKRAVKKVYFALSTAHPPKPRYQARWSDGLLKTGNKKRPMKISGDPKALSALTSVELFAIPEGTLLILSPKTGRTHQLRVQCKHHEFPILGDQDYGEKKEGSNMYLHAGVLAFVGVDGKKYLIKDFPTHWKISEEALSIVDRFLRELS